MRRSMRWASALAVLLTALIAGAQEYVRDLQTGAPAPPGADPVAQPHTATLQTCVSG
jgi:hypothetical protein